MKAGTWGQPAGLRSKGQILWGVGRSPGVGQKPFFRLGRRKCGRALSHKLLRILRARLWAWLFQCLGQGSDAGVHLAGGLGTVRVWVSEHVPVNPGGTEVAGGRSARGQLVTHPAVQPAAAEGIVPLSGALHHHAVLTLAPIVGLPRSPVAEAEGSENGGGGRSPTAFSLDTSVRVWALPTPSLQPRSTLPPHPLTSTWVCPPSRSLQRGTPPL